MTIIGSLLFILITRISLIIILTVTIEGNLSLAASLPYMAAPQYDDSDYMSYDEFVRSSSNRRNHNANYRRDTGAGASGSGSAINSNNNNLLTNNNNLANNNLLNNNNANLKEPSKNFKEMLKPRRQTQSKQANYNNLKSAVSKVQRTGRSNYIVGSGGIGAGVNSGTLGALNRLNLRSACPSQTTPENVQQLTCLIQAMHENTLALIKNLGELETTLLGVCRRNEKKKSSTPAPKQKCNDEEDTEAPDVCREVGGDESPNFDRFLKRREPASRLNSFNHDHSKNFIAETQGAIQAWESQLSDTRKLLNDFALHKSKKATAFNSPLWELGSNNNNYKSISNNNIHSNLNSNNMNSGYR